MTDLEKYKTADLVQELKHRFGLIIRLITNKCNKDTFYFLSFLPTVFRLPSLASYISLITLHQIICEIIYLAQSHLDLSTLTESLVTLRARPKIRMLEAK